MLADGVEAAVRVLAEPTPARIREVVDHIVRQRIEQGQLRDAPLTLRQLESVKEQFARVLLGHVSHAHRVPGGGRRRRRRGRGQVTIAVEVASDVGRLPVALGRDRGAGRGRAARRGGEARDALGGVRVARRRSPRSTAGT